MIKNYITFDLENWYDSDFVRKEDKIGKDFVLKGLGSVLKLLDKHKIKATFFVTGDVLEKYPKEIKKLHLMGHEIASHSYEHIMLNKLTDDEIKSNIINSKKLIKKITGKNPLGFRAPSWSIDKNRFWIYKFLEKEGFSYSSSLFPINVGAYGSFKFPIEEFKPTKKKIIEIPVRPWNFLGVRVPFSGGIYFRIWPKWISSYFIKRLNKKNKRIVLYVHPWELCPNIPRVKMNFIGWMISYYGINRTESKLDYILNKHKFDSFENCLIEDKKI